MDQFNHNVPNNFRIELQGMLMDRSFKSAKFVTEIVVLVPVQLSSALERFSNKREGR